MMTKYGFALVFCLYDEGLWWIHNDMDSFFLKNGCETGLLLFLHDSKYKLLNFQEENYTFLNTSAINSTRGLIGVCGFPWLTSPAEMDALGQILHSGKTCMSFCLKGSIKDCS